MEDEDMGPEGCYGSGCRRKDLLGGRLDPDQGSGELV